MRNWIEEVKMLADDELAMLRTLIEEEARNREQTNNAHSRVWHRCLRCNGTGKHLGGYCVCDLGRDLRQLETGGATYDIQPEMY